MFYNVPIFHEWEAFMKKELLIGTMLLALSACSATQHQTKANIYKTTPTGRGEYVGTVTFTDTEYGLRLDTDLKNLLPGEHGFHVHENPDCSAQLTEGKTVLAGKAGGHYDPLQSKKHLGPNQNGHKGDLPVLFVDEKGAVKRTRYIQGVTASEFKNRSVMIHEGADNYQDKPQPLGGGGGRIACGIIE